MNYLEKIKEIRENENLNHVQGHFVYLRVSGVVGQKILVRKNKICKFYFLSFYSKN